MVIVSHKNQYHFWGLLVFVEHSRTQSTTLSLVPFSLSASATMPPSLVFVPLSLSLPLLSPPPYPFLNLYMPVVC